ncbi:MAG: hypothetical protein LBG80_03220 [Bacteroidales bacterium]|nr:hypothetical protein [Bacteroidales bacterium]
MENYVLKYIIPAYIMHLYTPQEDILGVKFGIGFDGQLINSLIPENDDVLDKFRQIAKRNGDTTYYHPISTCFPLPCLSDGGSRFDVYCDKNYADYPAGASLNDLITIYFYSAMEFVKSNYATDNSKPVKEYCLPLNEFNSGNHYLLAYDKVITFILNAKPDDMEEYSFRFVYSDISGKEMMHDAIFKRGY